MDEILKITIPIENKILFSLKKTKEEFEKDVKYIIALNLYKKRKISLGKAAKLAGYAKIDFIHKLQFEGETIFEYLEDEIEEILKDGEKLKEIEK